MSKTHSVSRSRPRKNKQMDSDSQWSSHFFKMYVTAREKYQQVFEQLNNVKEQLNKVTQERDDLLIKQQVLNQQMASKF